MFVFWEGGAVIFLDIVKTFGELGDDTIDLFTVWIFFGGAFEVILNFFNLASSQ